MIGGIFGNLFGGGIGYGCAGVGQGYPPQTGFLNAMQSAKQQEAADYAAYLNNQMRRFAPTEEQKAWMADAVRNANQTLDRLSESAVKTQDTSIFAKFRQEGEIVIEAEVEKVKPMLELPENGEGSK